MHWYKMDVWILHTSLTEIKQEIPPRSKEQKVKKKLYIVYFLPFLLLFNKTHLKENGCKK